MKSSVLFTFRQPSETRNYARNSTALLPEYRADERPGTGAFRQSSSRTKKGTSERGLAARAATHYARGLLVLSLFAVWGQAGAQEKWKTDEVIILLHRAASLAAPENTVPALEAAVRQGADGVEIDIRRTRDGFFVLYHDDWVLRQRGPTGKIEEMTLVETQALDVGERFGPQWRGLHPPLFEDVLRFARANRLRLYLDIKTPGIYEEVLKKTTDLGCLPLVGNTGGQVPKNAYAVALPWARNWNYDRGGEEDPEKMARVAAEIPAGACQIMAEDARALAHALRRNPERRPFTAYVSTLPQTLAEQRKKPLSLPPKPSRDALYSSAPTVRRAACIAFAAYPKPSVFARLLELAAHDPDALVQQEACWTLGSLRDNRAVPTLLTVAQTPYDPKTGAQTDYAGVFIKIGAACALARLNSAPAREALRQLVASRAEFDRSAASIALAAFGTRTDVPLLVELVSPKPENAGFVVGSVLGHIGRLGADAIPIWIAALEQEAEAKFAVFGLAQQGAKAVPALKKIIAASATSPAVRRRANLALFWMPSGDKTPDGK